MVRVAPAANPVMSSGLAAAGTYAAAIQSQFASERPEGVTVDPVGMGPELVFTENETNFERLFGAPNRSAFCKDAFHLFVVGGDGNVVKLGGKAKR